MNKVYWKKNFLIIPKALSLRINNINVCIFKIIIYKLIII